MGHDVRVGKYPLQAHGRALTAGAGEGFVKIVTEQKYDEILGIHIIGPAATDLISEAAALLPADMLDGDEIIVMLLKPSVWAVPLRCLGTLGVVAVAAVVAVLWGGPGAAGATAQGLPGTSPDDAPGREPDAYTLAELVDAPVEFVVGSWSVRR